jgi:hypothetical protein
MRGKLETGRRDSWLRSIRGFPFEPPDPISTGRVLGFCGRAILAYRASIVFGPLRPGHRVGRAGLQLA